jgi:hypothetical protein
MVFVRTANWRTKFLFSYFAGPDILWFVDLGCQVLNFGWHYFLLLSQGIRNANATQVHEEERVWRINVNRRWDREFKESILYVVG